MSDDNVDHDVSRSLLESISHAVSVLGGGANEDETLRESFRMAVRGVSAQRAFLAAVDAQRSVSAVLQSEGLSRREIDAVRLGRSAPGLSVSLVRKALQTGRPQHLEDSRRVVGDFERTDALAGGEWSVVCAPVVDPHTRSPLAVLYLQTHSLSHPLTAAVLPHVQSYAMVLGQTWSARRHVPGELASLRLDLAAARAALASGRSTVEIIGNSDETAALRDRLRRVILPAMTATRPDPILILGPTGTGKEVVARYLHAHSIRARGRFVALNCASLKGELVEAELFGYVRGAYTGAVGDSEGLFVMAHGGVLFLDEVGDMPPQGQSALLRALETRSARPVGGRDERAFDVQLLCATNVDLAAAVRARRFRQDLYHRIRGITVALSPLSARRGDIAPLLSHFLAHHEQRAGKRTLGLADEARQLLERYDWPGNVREVSATCSALVMHAEPGGLITVPMLAEAVPELYAAVMHVPAEHELEVLFDAPYRSLREAMRSLERAYLARLQRRMTGNRSAMARWLHLQRRSLYRHLLRVGLIDPAEAQREGGPDGETWDAEDDER